MELGSMRELFVHELRDLHDAEKQILEALPKNAYGKVLKTELRRHMSGTA